MKTVYVAANHCDSVELFVNGNNPQRRRHYQTPGNNGYILRLSRNQIRARHNHAPSAKPAAKSSRRTKSKPPASRKRLKLTRHTGPNGLQADGSDVAFFDVEVVDAQGRRCPTDEARVDFKLDGPALWRGGYNSGMTNSVNNLYLDTECGINRVAIRSTLQPGTITLTATRAGLEPATVRLESKPVQITHGLLEPPPAFQF